MNTQLAIIACVPLLALGLTLPRIHLNVTERQTDYISLKWEVTNDVNDSIQSYQVHVDDMMTYKNLPFIDNEKNTAQVLVHESNKKYNICVDAMLNEEAGKLAGKNYIRECIEESTIKTMQVSSLVALVLTILFFVLCFLIGYISWKCAARKIKGEQQYEKSDANENGDIVPLTHIED